MKHKIEPGDIDSISRRLIFVITMLLIVMMAARTPMDSDVWWHLRSGQVTVEAGKPLTIDVFSFTRENQDWVNHSWLAQVLLFGANQFGSYTGLALWVVVLAVVCLTLVYLQLKGAAWWRSLLVILAAVAIAPVWSPRPQMVSLAFLAGLSWFTKKWREGGLRSLWTLPILFLAWSNLHGGYPLGFLLLAAFLVGQVFDHYLGNKVLVLPWQKLKVILLWSLLAYLAVAINPNGVKMWTIPFETLEVDSLQQYIQEWASPDFHDPTQQPILILIFLLIGSLGLSGLRASAVEWLACGGFLLLALMSRRNIAAFALISLPVISEHGWAVLEAGLDHLKSNKRLALFTGETRKLRPHPGLNLLITGFIAMIAFGKLGVVTLSAVGQAAEAGIFPQAAVEWVRGHPAKGNTLSEYSWGGYLSWKLPEDKVFVDGRTDLFGDQIIGEWRQVVQAEQSMMEILDHWEVKRVLLQPDRPAIAALIDQGWVIVYQDHVSIILEPKEK